MDKQTENTCIDCEAEIEIPEDALEGEIVSCPDCGADFEIEKTEDGLKLKILALEAEDWGE
ncbi:MAG: lysine biosynthesis protein LysW [Candidatus Bathyarchaeota archaeon]|jgi:alpha-aminoadipate carrier protein LysW|nr:MAG: lysine biosynthesis protein LysW [Candidatus Bathyarchaeota archaeon]